MCMNVNKFPLVLTISSLSLIMHNEIFCTIMEVVASLTF